MPLTNENSGEINIAEGHPNGNFFYSHVVKKYHTYLRIHKYNFFCQIHFCQGRKIGFWQTIGKNVLCKPSQLESKCIQNFSCYRDFTATIITIFSVKTHGYKCNNICIKKPDCRAVKNRFAYLPIHTRHFS